MLVVRAEHITAAERDGAFPMIQVLSALPPQQKQVLCILAKLTEERTSTGAKISLSQLADSYNTHCIRASEAYIGDLYDLLADNSLAEPRNKRSKRSDPVRLASHLCVEDVKVAFRDVLPLAGLLWPEEREQASQQVNS